MATASPGQKSIKEVLAEYEEFLKKWHEPTDA
jgi:hypothetical protein